MQVAYDVFIPVTLNPFNILLLWYKISEQRKVKAELEDEKSNSLVAAFQEKIMMLGKPAEGRITHARRNAACGFIQKL